jgi:hypothetical protein
MVGPRRSPRNKTNDSKKKKHINDDVVQEPEVLEVKDVEVLEVEDEDEEEDEEKDSFKNDNPFYYYNGWYPIPGEEPDESDEPPYGYYPWEIIDRTDVRRFELTKEVRRKRIRKLQRLEAAEDARIMQRLEASDDAGTTNNASDNAGTTNNIKVHHAGRLMKIFAHCEQTSQYLIWTWKEIDNGQEGSSNPEDKLWWVKIDHFPDVIC